jgi:hypothetical protein
MNLALHPSDADAWARRIRSYEGEVAYRELIITLKADPPNASLLLDRLAELPDPVVRAWAGTAAVEVLGQDAIPLLTRLQRDRDPDVRDVARQDLVAIDPAFERSFFPQYRRALRRRADPWGEDRVAMHTLSRARDPEAAPLLREYAAHYEPRYWHNRMPLVLADYIEDPESVTRRIRDHDHDFMYWLVEATAMLDIPDAEDALTEALGRATDETCTNIIRERLDQRRLRPAAT